MFCTNRNAVKKKGRRFAGTWGRVNLRSDMRAESKGTRKAAKKAIRRVLREEI